MAPSPEPQGTEPKAPDKSSNQNNDNSRKDFNSSVEVSDYNTSDDIEMKSLCSSTDDKQEAAASDVSDLNDGELKALLDEAYNYKSPKDREGKSEIFKKFLQEAETAEIEGGPEKGLLFAEAPGARSAGSGGSKRRSGRREAGRAVSEGQSRCGSLQNLSQCHVVDTWQLLHHTPNCSSSLSSGSRRSRHGPSQFRRGASTSSTCSSATSESVSTRQREGGSLPCSVNAVHHTVNDCCVGDDDSHPSLQDLTNWHSSYCFRGNSMPKLPSSSPGSTVAADESPPPPQQEVVSQQGDGKAQRSSTGPPGFYKQPREEVTTELIAHVEAVKPEKQSEAAETKDHEMYSPTPSYCSSYKVQLGVPPSTGAVTQAPTPSAPAQVDETADFGCLSTTKAFENVCFMQFHQSNPEGPIVMHSGSGSNLHPLQLKDCDAVCSVMGATPARQQTDNNVVTTQNKNAITRADMSNVTRGKPIVYTTGSSSSSSTPRVYCAPNDDTGTMWERSGNKSVMPATKLDENGNAVRENSDSATVRKKKQKDKNKPLVLSQNVEGFCGDRDLNDLLSYIEGETDTSQQQAKQVKQKRSKDTPQSQQEQLASGRRSQRHSEEGSESGKRSKGKERGGRTKIQRANSLEEVSRTKLEDLTAPPESCRSVGDGRNSQASNWGDLDDEIEESENLMDAQNGNTTIVTNNGLKQHFHMGDDSAGFKVSINEDFYAILEASPQHTEDREEFHVVTKKQRRKKQRNRQDDHSNRHSSGYHKRGDYDEDDDSSLHSFGCRSYRSHQTDRRKCKSTSSMPPSDQSGGESSDLDSVHSLPVSSTTNKSNLDKTSSGSAPQASYADITRMASINPAPELPTNKTSTPKSTQQNHSKNQKVNQAESWEEWPQVCNNKSVSVSSQTAQDMPKKDAMTSTCVDPSAVPLQVSAASVPSVSSVSSSISPASSTISSSNATEPNTPPDTNILQDFPPLIPSLAESLDKRRVAEDTEKRKSDEPVHENNLPPLPPKNKVSVSNINNTKQIINSVDQVKPSELNSTDVNKSSVVSSSAVMVNGGEHFEQKIVKFSDYKTRTLTKPPAFVCIPHQAPQQQQQQQQQQQPPPSLAPPQAALTTVVTPPSAAQQPQETHQQPAVILLNETQRSDSNSDVSGLTFGFEINELLLSQGEPIEMSEDRGEPAASSPQPISDLPSPAPSVVPTPTALVSIHQKTKDFAAMFRNTRTPETQAYNSTEIIEYIGQAWDKVLQDMSSGLPIKFYSKE